MSTEERQQVWEFVELEKYPANEIIIREGRSTQCLWIITKGRCQVFKNTRYGGEQELAVLDEYKVFGEMSFLNPAPHSATVRALTDVEVVRLNRDRYDRLLEIAPMAALKLAFNMVGVLAERLRTMDEWTCELVEKSDSGKHRDEWRDFRAKLYSEWQF